MKKWIVISIVIIGLIITSAYIFFPKKITSSNVERFNCNIHSVNRFVMNENNWGKWWPGTMSRDSASNKTVFAYNGYKYKITGIQYNALLIQCQSLDLNIDEIFFFYKRGIDTIQAEWRYSLSTISNPINRIYLYFETKKINNNITDIMNRMKSFLEKQENVYGMRIHEEIVKDTILVTTNFKATQYPSTQKIYELLNGIKNYISLHNAKQTDYPMLHVVEDSGFYKTQVAIPVNVAIPDSKIYLTKRMVPGKILVGQVTGGAYKARDALRQLGIYMSDNNLSSPAIPFESLITNRIEEQDSSKWITKIYYPVF